MRLGHFHSIGPVCPQCRAGEHLSPLAITLIEAETAENIISGILGCPQCGSEFPILDGMPVLLRDIRRFVQDNLFFLLARNDLTPGVESLIGDAAGPGSGLESIRQHVSSYAWDHWGDLDPGPPISVAGGCLPGGVLRNLATGLELIAGEFPPGPILDIGCGPGRTTMELAERTGRDVLGIDVSIPLARIGSDAINNGAITYGVRRNGLVYERRHFALASGGHRRADIWICDAMALPFAPDSFAMAVAMNVLDCMSNPQMALTEIERVLAPRGQALMSVPFDWTGHVTPVESWIGGHSQRAAHSGNPQAILEMMLTDGPLAAGALRRKKPAIEVPWHVRLHDRSCMQYLAYMVAATKNFL